MKKIFLALVVTAFMFTACKPTEVVKTPVTVSLSQTSMSGMFLSSAMHKSVTVTVSNTTGDAADITWERVATNDPTGFTYMVNGAADMSGTVSIPANSSVDVTLMVHPNGNTGTASGMIKFYDAEDMTNTMKTVNYSLTAVSSLFNAIPRGSLTVSAKASTNTDYYIDVVNPNQDTLVLKWGKASNIPTNWVDLLCVFKSVNASDNQCFPPSVISGNATIAPLDTIEIKATIQPNSNAGTGTIDILIYAPSDSASTVVVEQINHTATS